MKLKLFYLLIAIFGLTNITACSDDDDNNKPAVNPNIPEAVAQAFKDKYPDVDQSKVQWETKGIYTVAEFKTLDNQNDVEAWFTKAGEWKMTENDYGKDLFMIPTVINEAFVKSEYGTWQIDDISYYEYPTESSNFYLIEVEKTGQPDTQLYFKTDGTTIKTTTDTNVDITPDTQVQPA